MNKPSEKWQAADYLTDQDSIAEYINAAIESGEPELINAALRDVSDAMEGMTRLAKKTGLTRQSLYKALGKDGNPKLTSLLSIMEALGLQLAVKPIHR